MAVWLSVMSDGTAAEVDEERGWEILQAAVKAVIASWSVAKFAKEEYGPRAETALSLITDFVLDSLGGSLSSPSSPL